MEKFDISDPHLRLRKIQQTIQEGRLREYIFREFVEADGRAHWTAKAFTLSFTKIPGTRPFWFSVRSSVSSRRFNAAMAHENGAVAP